MTNASIKNTFATLAVVALAMAVSFGTFATIVRADDDLGYYGTSENYYGTDSSDLGYYGTSDNLGYFGTDSGDLGYYGTSDNLGYYGTSDNDLGYYGTSDNLGYYGTQEEVFGTDVYGTDVIEEHGVGYSYHEYENDFSQSYSSPSCYSCSSSSKPFSFSAPSTYYPDRK